MTPAQGDKVTLTVRGLYGKNKGRVLSCSVHTIRKILTWGSVELSNGSTLQIRNLTAAGANAWTAAV